jgi:hypothetical protein
MATAVESTWLQRAVPNAFGSASDGYHRSITLALPERASYPHHSKIRPVPVARVVIDFDLYPKSAKIWRYFRVADHTPTTLNSAQFALPRTQ